MKKILLLSLILLGLHSSAQEQERVLKWQYIQGSESESGKAYIETVSLRSSSIDGTGYGAGIFLYVYNKPVDMMTAESEKMTVTSVANYIVADCKNAAMVVQVRLFFNTKNLPMYADEPIKMIDYSEGKPNIIPLPTSSPVYNILCPRYL